MATLQVRSIASSCLGKSGTLSLKKDVFGVYGTNNQTRTLKNQLDLVQNKAFVRVALVTIATPSQGQSPNVQRDLDNANTVYQTECDAWVYCEGSITKNRPDLLTLDQDDCSGSGHSVSDEEDDLFDLGRNQGADVVGYYINGSAGTTFRGCAAHPPGRRGFWCGTSATQWTFAHELTHIVGDNSHGSAGGNTDNLMISNTGTITNAPPDLTSNQCNDILADPDMESCS